MTKISRDYYFELPDPDVQFLFEWPGNLQDARPGRLMHKLKSSAGRYFLKMPEVTYLKRKRRIFYPESIEISVKFKAFFLGSNLRSYDCRRCSMNKASYALTA
jgi:hypothetical protein